MSETLYRKYRPQNFSDVVGQQHVKTTLENQIKSGTFAHAYLFSGPRGVGKTTMARLLAKALNCENRKDSASEPCNECRACTEISGGSSLDLIEIDAASNTGVDNVRTNIIESTRFAPVANKNKVFIIDEVHMLSTSAFNALLKTLEEPPANVVFILATTERHKIPATIISRCQTFQFKFIESSVLVERLKGIIKDEKIKVDSSILDLIARSSEGCLRDAESLLGQVLALGEKEITFEQASLVLPVDNFNEVLVLVEHIQAGNIKAAISHINTIMLQGVDMEQFVDELVEFFRKLLFKKIGEVDKFTISFNKEMEQKIEKLVSGFSDDQLKKIIVLAIEVKSAMKRQSLKQLPLEIFVIEAIGDERIKSEDSPTQDFSESKKKPLENKSPKNQQSSRETSNEKQAGVSEAEKGNPKTSIQNSASNIKMTLEDIKQRWSAVIKKIQEKNASLPFVLKLAEPVRVEADTVELGFQYKFHQETINETKNRIVIEEGMSDVIGEAVKIKGVYLEKTNNETVSEVLSAFGGNVIE